MKTDAITGVRAQDRYSEAQAELRALQGQRKAAPASYNQAVARADSAAMISAKREIRGLDEEIAAQLITVATLDIEALEERRAEALALAESPEHRASIAARLATIAEAESALETLRREHNVEYGTVQAASRTAVTLEADIRDARTRLDRLIAGQLLAV